MQPGTRLISPPVFYTRSTNTTLRKCLLGRYLAICQQTNASQEAGYMEFDIEKDRFSFYLAASYSEKRRRAPAERQKQPRAISREVWYNFFEKVLDLM